MKPRGDEGERPGATDAPGGLRAALTYPFRALGGPFLPALRRQVGSAVEDSSLPTRLDALATRLDAFATRLEQLTRQQDKAIAELSGRLDAISGRLDAAAAAPPTDQLLAPRLDALALQADEQARGLNALTDAGRPLARVIPLGAEVAFRTPLGWVLHPAEDLALLIGLIEAGGIHETGARIVLQAMLAPGDFAVDAGAHVGIMTLAMTGAVGPQGRVLAVEPTPRLAALLRRTAVMNNLQGVMDVADCALGRAEGQAVLSMEDSLMNSSLLPLAKAKDSVEVPVRPLDALVAPGTAAALVKLDVEGAELDAWAGMSRVVAESPDLAAVVEFAPAHLQRAGNDIDGWLRAFTAKGFTPWEIDDLTGAISPLRQRGRLDAVGTLNLLMLRHSPDRWPRLARAPG